MKVLKIKFADGDQQEIQIDDYDRGDHYLSVSPKDNKPQIFFPLAQIKWFTFDEK